jgi:tight adherence protein B
MDPTLILIVGGGLSLILFAVGLVSSLVGGGSVVEERLGQVSEAGGMLLGREADREVERERSTPITDFLNRLGEGSDFFERLSRDLARADVKLRAAEYFITWFLAAIVTGAIGYFLGGILIAIVGAIFGFFIPRIYIGRAQKSRLKKFDNQLGDMLNLMVNGLRAGFSTLQAMEAVSRELPSPISSEFRRVVQEMQLGIPMEEALDHLLRRINSDDLDLCITAINVQREVGGNLAEILDVISYTIRERVRIKGEIAALTAQGRATAWVISALPIILVLLLFVINRQYVMQFFNPETRGCGIPILVLAGLMIVSGFIATQKIVQIDI